MPDFKKKFSFKLLLVVFLTAAFLPLTALAQGIPGLSFSAGVDASDSSYLFTTPEGTQVPVVCPAIAGTYPATAADIAAMITCIQQAATKASIDLSASDLKQITALQKKAQREEMFAKMMAKAKDVLAISFRSSLKQFSQQIAHDTAVWIASGGKGQQPLFITEGWGQYLKNAADSALGDFIDNIGQEYGVDMCRPNINVRLAIETGINWQQPREVTCTFSQMMDNWQSAVQNANFSVEYVNSLRPGENDVSTFLMLQSGAFQTVAESVKIKGEEGSINGMFKSVNSFVGTVLTPGTVVADAFRGAVNPTGKNASFGMETFTGTIADIIEEFLNTLVSQLLTNLQNGLFTSDSVDKDNTNPFDLPDLSDLFNPNASPRDLSGAKGAAERFRNLVDRSGYRVGNSYDILVKLMTCTESALRNPGPTDCVIDNAFGEDIRQMKQVKDISPAILDRQFAPSVNQVVSPQQAISLRSIKILRKYRIVPVGWEVAAEKIAAQGNKSYTLRELMNLPVDHELYGLIDPYWVVKVPELFCRKVGYGYNNSFANTQDQSVTREEYCADEQQCLAEGDNGCKSFGYCTEERRVWDTGGTTCEPRFNTCEALTGRDGTQNAWLLNTADARFCNADNVGCRWYSLAYNTISNTWINTDPSNVLNACTANDGCNVSVTNAAVVAEGKSMSPDRKVIMAQACSADACSSQNLIKNGGFENSMTSTDSGWTWFDGNLVPTNNVKNAISTGYVNWQGGVTNATVNVFMVTGSDTGAFGTVNSHGGSKMFIFRNPGPTGYKVLTHQDVNLKAGKKYVFSAYVNYASGNTTLNAMLDMVDAALAQYGPDSNHYDTSGSVALVGGWQKLSLEYQPTTDISIRPRIVIEPPGPNGYVYVDNVQLQEVGLSHCAYNADAKACSMTGSCTIPKGGVYCAVDNCVTGVSLLAALNGSFEDAYTSQEFRADKWNFDQSYANVDNRHYREKVIGNNDYNLVLRSANNASILTTYVDRVTTTPGDTYQLSFSGRGDYLAKGGYSVSVYGNDPVTPLAGVSFQSVSSIWLPYNFNFTIPAGTERVKVVISTAAYSQGLVYLDKFEMKKVDSDCAYSSFWLTKGTVPATTSEIYLDAQAQSCDGSAAGCSQFIRTKPGAGANLIYNGSFNNGTTSWENYNGHFQFKSVGGNNFVTADYNSNTYAYYNYINIVPGQYYIVSYDSAQINTAGTSTARFEMFFAPNTTAVANPGDFVAETTCNGPASFNASDNTIALYHTPGGTSFERVYCRFKAPANSYVMRFKPFTRVLGEIINFDNIMIETAQYNQETPSAYSEYAQTGPLAYLKKAPDYFDCYRSTSTNDWANGSTIYNILAGQAPVCKRFAPVCTVEEVGCELYKPTNGDPVVPGIVDGLDVCPSECAGYSVFQQEKTNFVASKYRQFIADNNLKYCPAASAGCDEFTNLDNVASGGEKREYYTQLRACQKTDAPDASRYVTFEGSDVTGYQLKVYNLKKSTENTDAPCTYITYNASGVAVCSDSSIVGNVGNAGYCTRNDMFTNPDCREFYSEATGVATTRLLSRTISISADCHPYRRTQTQVGYASVLASTEAQADCNVNQGWWNNSACVYMAIPSEGRTCPAAAYGCREYTGNQANNVRNIINSNFGTNSVSTSSWQNDAGTTAGLQISMESSFVGGYSLHNLSTSVVKYPVNITKGKAYLLSFWAKSGTAVNFQMTDIKFTSAATGLANTFTLTSSSDSSLANAKPTITGDWRKYDLGPVFVTWTPGDNDYLRFDIGGSNKMYLDNVILKEVTNDIFAIENSWFTPLSCDNLLGDPTGDKAVADGTCQQANATFRGTRCSIGEMIGCASYIDRAKQVNYFRSFAKLCRTEAAGCEDLIDTYNSTRPEQQTFNAGDGSEVTVPADEHIYLVNDSRYACSAGDKGCTAMGLPMINKYEDVFGYNTVFLKNNPDVYDRIMCKANENWCDQYVGPSSVRYLKNPHGRVCAYEERNGNGNWYEAGTDNICASTLDQTFGSGQGNTEAKSQPIGLVNNASGEVPSSPAYGGWVGVCPASQSGCTEFVDPLPTIYQQANFENNKAVLKTHTLYTTDYAPAISIPDASVSYPDQSQSSSLKRFYIYGTSSEQVYLNITGNPKLVKSGVYYAINSTVNRGSCGGVFQYDTGCVLFNDRSQMLGNSSTTNWAEKSSSYLTYDSAETYKSYIGQSVSLIDRRAVAPVSSNNNDSSVILKVKPNRTCASWLTCTTYEKKDPSQSNPIFTNEDKCMGIGLCDSVNSRGECDHFISSTPVAAGYNASTDANKTGYAYIASTPAASYYSFENMDQKGESSLVVNGGFEEAYGGNNSSVPLGWKYGYYDYSNMFVREKTAKVGSPLERFVGTTGSGTDSRDSVNFQEMGINRDPKVAMEGFSTLRLNTGNVAISEDVELEPNTDYYFSAWVNTRDLQSPNINSTAEVNLKFFNNVGVPMSDPIVGSPGMNADKWIYSSELSSKIGQPWKKLVFYFRTKDNTSRMQITLFNLNNSGDKGESLGGYSLWDDIQLKPLLKVNDTQMLSRSCRVYPAQDAPSCKYTSGSNAYYGLYGYCMLNDPANPSQCLQWWPVDSLKGEVMDDFNTYYKERAPLYYCTHKSNQKYYFFKAGVMMNTSGELPSKYSSVLQGDSGINMNAFSVPKSARPLFRYPFLYRIPVTIIGGGVGSDKAVYIDMVMATMYPKRVCTLSLAGLLGDGLLCYSAMDNSINEGVSMDGPPSGAEDNSGDGVLETLWNGITTWIREQLSKLLGMFTLFPEDEWGGIGWLVIAPKATKSIGFALNIPLPWHEALQVKSGGGALIAQIGDWINNKMGGGTVGVRIVTDMDKSASLADPVPSLPGDILGYASFMDVGSIFAAGAPVIFGDGFNVEYCDTVVQVVNSAGQNKSWATRLSPGSLYQNTSAAAMDCVKDQEKTIRNNSNPGSSCFYASDYCLVNDCVRNDDRICNFCNNYVGKFEGSVITKHGFDVTASVCPAGTTAACGESLFYVSAGTANKLLCGGVENRNYFCFLPGTGSMSLNFRILANSSKYVYRKIYAQNTLNYTADYKPYGSLVAPKDTQYPTQWDSRPETPFNDPLYYEMPDTSQAAPYQARSGQRITRTNLKQLFAQTYGAWQYSAAAQGYVASSSVNWGLPRLCTASEVDPTTGTRIKSSVYSPVCRIRPDVGGLTITNTSNATKLTQPIAIKAGFNVKVDPEQVPISSYVIDWGDGARTSYSGVSLLPRPSDEFKFNLYHYYKNGGTNGLFTIQLKAKDNWNAVGCAQYQINVLSNTTTLQSTSCAAMLIGADGTDPDDQSDSASATAIKYGDIITLRDGSAYLTINTGGKAQFKAITDPTTFCYTQRYVQYVIYPINDKNDDGFVQYDDTIGLSALKGGALYTPFGAKDNSVGYDWLVQTMPSGEEGFVIRNKFGKVDASPFIQPNFEITLRSIAEHGPLGFNKEYRYAKHYTADFNGMKDLLWMHAEEDSADVTPLIIGDRNGSFGPVTCSYDNALKYGDSINLRQLNKVIKVWRNSPYPLFMTDGAESAETWCAGTTDRPSTIFKVRSMNGSGVDGSPVIYGDAISLIDFSGKTVKTKYTDVASDNWRTYSGDEGDEEGFVIFNNKGVDNGEGRIEYGWNITLRSIYPHYAPFVSVFKKYYPYVQTNEGLYDETNGPPQDANPLKVHANNKYVNGDWLFGILNGGPADTNLQVCKGNACIPEVPQGSDAAENYCNAADNASNDLGYYNYGVRNSGLICLKSVDFGFQNFKLDDFKSDKDKCQSEELVQIYVAKDCLPFTGQAADNIDEDYVTKVASNGDCVFLQFQVSPTQTGMLTRDGGTFKYYPDDSDPHFIPDSSLDMKYSIHCEGNTVDGCYRGAEVTFQSVGDDCYIRPRNNYKTRCDDIRTFKLCNSIGNCRDRFPPGYIRE